jgi:hypothetical protein
MKTTAAAAAATVAAGADPWCERAKQLAEAAQLTGTARQLVPGDKFFEVPSRDRTGWHRVEIQPHTGRVRCTCVAGSFSRPCCHSGAVLLAVEQRVRALSVAACASQRRYDLRFEEEE